MGSDVGARLRRDLVAHLVGRGHLRDERTTEAFATVAREHFLPALAERSGLAAVYRDEVVVTRRDGTTGAPLSSSSQPAIMADMLEMLDVRPGARVLEIGAGTGYNAALLCHLAGEAGSITSVELDPVVADEARAHLRAAGAPARVVVGDGRLGVEDAGPFDRIVATASVDSIPRAWCDQLVPGGLLVVPLRLSPVLGAVQAVVALRRVRGGFDLVAATGGGFLPLRADPASAPPVRAARVTAADPSGTGEQAPPPLVDITGPALAGLDRDGRRDLLLTALGFGRSRRIGVDWPVIGPALELYVALDLPEERLVDGAHAGATLPGTRTVGTLDAVDGSLAFLVVTDGRAAVFGYGGPAAERALVAAARRWARAGWPGIDRLAITVRYGPERPHAWRSLRRGDQWIAVDWRPAATPAGRR